MTWPKETARALTAQGRQDQGVGLPAHHSTAGVPVAAPAAEINAEHELAQQAAETAVHHAVRCGELLLTVKASLKHGDFMPWIEKNCKFQQSTATRYINAARQIATGVAISSIRGLFPSGDAHNHRTQGKIRKTDTLVREIEDHAGDEQDVQQPDHRAQGDVDHDDDDVQLDHVDDEAEPEPRRTKRQSRAQRWGDAVEQAIAALGDLIEIQGHYQEWRDGLPENLSGSSVAEKLDGVIEIDLQGALDTVNEAQNADLPLGFGRD